MANSDPENPDHNPEINPQAIPNPEPEEEAIPEQANPPIPLPVPNCPLRLYAFLARCDLETLGLLVNSFPGQNRVFFRFYYTRWTLERYLLALRVVEGAMLEHELVEDPYHRMLHVFPVEALRYVENVKCIHMEIEKPRELKDKTKPEIIKLREKAESDLTPESILRIIKAQV
ncbi:hypothetical protein CASFOL_037912 [Castilleja foliolosa]|uniref:Uncharacterized protein n=1 Tax=Castilleja foliolosa TaxID=1961234 RepID=A0ABD3BKM9_9LAMI